jgi:hypothetical protein
VKIQVEYIALTPLCRQLESVGTQPFSSSYEVNAHHF